LGKRSWSDEKSGDDEVNSYNKEKRTNAGSQEDAAAGSASAAASQEDTAAAASPATVSDRASAEAIPDGAASDVSSPIRRPYMVREPWDSANIIPYQDENAKYQAKLGMLLDPSLSFLPPFVCMVITI
jgi:hypothetical protein